METNIFEKIKSQSKLDIKEFSSWTREHKSQINKKNSLGITLLHIASGVGNLEAVNILLNNGANPNQQDKNRGWTALHFAAHHKHLMVLLLLLQHGGNIIMQDKEQQTPADCLAKYAADIAGATTTEARKKKKLTRELYTWGRGVNFQLGTGFSEDKTNPTRVKALDGINLQGVSCSKFHTAVVSTKGHLYTWGFGTGGRLGHGDEGSQHTPRRVCGPLVTRRIVSVSVSSSYSAALSDEGALFTFGNGDLGQLGLGPAETSTSVPKRVKGILDKKMVTQVCAGKHHLMCVTTDKEMYSFGYGFHGALGYDVSNAENQCQYLPRMVSTLKGGNITHITVGSKHTLYVVDGVDLFILGFGKSYPRRIYFGSKNNKPTVYQVHASGSKSVVVTSDGVYVWVGESKDLESSKPKLIANWINNNTERVQCAAIGGGRIALVTEQGNVFEYDEFRGLTRIDIQRVTGISVSKLHFAALVTVNRENLVYSTLNQDLAKFVCNSLYADLEFVLDTKRVPAHKVVLACRSPYFKKLFIHSKEKQVQLPGIQEDSLNCVLHYIYTDAHVPSSNIEEVRKLSQKFKLTRLNLLLASQIPDITTKSVPPSSYQDDFGWGLTPEAECLSDILLRVEDVCIPANKVMIARCGFFESCLVSGMKETIQNCITLGDARLSIMHKILQFMYTDQFPTSSQQIYVDTLVQADQLLLPGLKELTAQRLVGSIDLTNVATLLQLAEIYSVGELKTSCFEFILQNFAILLSRGELMGIGQEPLAELEEKLKSVREVGFQAPPPTSLEEAMFQFDEDYPENETSKRINQLRKQLARINQLEQRASSTSEWLTDEQTARISQKQNVLNEIEKLKTLQATEESSHTRVVSCSPKVDTTVELPKKGRKRSNSKKQNQLAQDLAQPLSGTPPASAVVPSTPPEGASPTKQQMWTKISPCNLSTSPTQKTLLQIQEEQYHQQVLSHKTKGTKPLEIQPGGNQWRVLHKDAKSQKVKKQVLKETAPAAAWKMAGTDRSPTKVSLLEIQKEEQTTPNIPKSVYNPPAKKTNGQPESMREAVKGKTQPAAKEMRPAWTATSPPKQAQREANSLQSIQMEQELIDDLKLIYGEGVTEFLAENGLGLEALLE